MSEATDLLSLAERVEGASGPDRELDEAIQVALAGAVAEWQEYKGCNAYHRDGHWVSIGKIEPYTTSLDAALTLKPEGWLWSVTEYPGKPVEAALVECRADEKGVYWHGRDMVDTGRIKAATAALAIVAACLRARAHSTPAEEGE